MFFDIPYLSGYYLRKTAVRVNQVISGEHVFPHAKGEMVGKWMACFDDFLYNFVLSLQTSLMLFTMHKYCNSYVDVLA